MIIILVLIVAFPRMKQTLFGQSTPEMQAYYNTHISKRITMAPAISWFDRGAPAWLLGCESATIWVDGPELGQVHPKDCENSRKSLSLVEWIRHCLTTPRARPARRGSRLPSCSRPGHGPVRGPAIRPRLRKCAHAPGRFPKGSDKPVDARLRTGVFSWRLPFGLASSASPLLLMAASEGSRRRRMMARAPSQPASE